MSLKNLGLIPDPLVRTVLALSLLVLTSLFSVLVFWGLTFSHQHELIPKVVFLRLTCPYQQGLSPKVFESMKCFGAQITYFLSKFENQFYSYSLSQTLPLSLQPLCFHQKYY